MKVTLEAIKFNHTLNSATTDAFAVRRNETESIIALERQRLVSLRPEDFPAAYAWDLISGQTITIQAKFKCSDPQVRTLRMQALDGHLGFTKLRYRGSWERRIGSIMLRLLRRFFLANVLGKVVEREVVFNDQGISEFETFDLADVRIQAVGVGVSDVIWSWQYSLNSSDWFDFATSNHRVYTVLRLPTRPWEPNSADDSNTQLPWTEVLEYACRWASRATDARDAIRRITNEVNKLGQGILQFDEDGHGATHLTFDEPTLAFDCAEFLKILAGTSNNTGGFVNCDDCAAIVSSFANILGCDVPESSMFPPNQPDFPLKRHLRIGSETLQRGAFMYHTAAWAGGVPDEVCDAYLQLDDSDDESGTLSPVPATNLSFGTGPKNYRFLLVATGHESECEPLPNSIMRRRIGVGE